MSKRTSNQLPNNLPQLQNCIKRDPDSYKEEFLQQYRHYEALTQVFQYSPENKDKDFEDLVMFLSQISHCYQEELLEFPNDLMNLLRLYATVLHHDVRLCMCKALILLRNKGLLTATDLLSLFFELLKCRDKNLRVFLKNYIITDIKNMNSKHKDMKLNTTLQNFMYTMLKDNNAIAAKTSLDIMVVLYTKHVWRDAKTVNVIATACFSKVTKIMVAALKFFLGKDDDGHKDSDSDDSDDEKNPHKIVSEMSLANRVNKKSKKRQKLLERTKNVTKKSKQKNKAPDFNFSAIHLLHDPQGLAEKLFKLLDKLRERFEVKLMVMNFLSRLIGIHQLFIFNFYPLIQRFLQPHQKEVTKILVYAAQSAHELVPPDVLEPVLKTIANNFITERNSSEGMAVGLNAARELCARCPLVMTEDLLQDLSMYGTMKDKNVSMAAKSIIQFYRVTNPQMLRRKDRGRPTEETKNMKPLEYGQLDSKNYVPGAEVLAEKKDGGESEHSDDDGEWVDADDDIEENSDENESGDGDSDVEDEDDDAVELEERPTKKLKTTDSEKLPIDFKLGNTEVATMISADRILTDEDFKAIRKAQLIKQIRASNPKKKEQIDSDVDSDDLEDAFEKKEIVSLKEIERLYKKSRPTKESRLASVQAGREGREKFGSRKEKKSPHASTNDREKRKHKPYAMVKHKVIAKKKRSFQDKQQALRQSLIKRMKAN